MSVLFIAIYNNNHKGENDVIFMTKEQSTRSPKSKTLTNSYFISVVLIKLTWLRCICGSRKH